MYRNGILYKHEHRGEIMIFGRKQEWCDNNINIMYIICTWGHGHVRPELTGEARRGGRFIKKIITIITMMAPQTNWRENDSDDGLPRLSLCQK